MPKFFASKLKVLGGNPRHSQLVRFGASLTLNGVTITTVPAVHSNGIAPGMIAGEPGEIYGDEIYGDSIPISDSLLLELLVGIRPLLSRLGVIASRDSGVAISRIARIRGTAESKSLK